MKRINSANPRNQLVQSTPMAPKQNFTAPCCTRFEPLLLGHKLLRFMALTLLWIRTFSAADRSGQHGVHSEGVPDLRKLPAPGDVLFGLLKGYYGFLGFIAGTDGNSAAYQKIPKLTPQPEGPVEVPSWNKASRTTCGMVIET